MSITFYDKQEAIEYVNDRKKEGYAAKITRRKDRYTVTLLGNKPTVPLDYNLTHYNLTNKMNDRETYDRTSEDEQEIMLAISRGNVKESGTDEAILNKNLPELKKKGYIEYVGDEDIDTLLNKLPNGEVKEVVSTYVKIAKEENVSDLEIEKAKNILLTGFKSNLFGGYVTDDSELEVESALTGKTSKLKKLQESLENAKTRGDKIIAIDTAMAYFHQGAVDVKEWRRSDGAIVIKILDKLFHGEEEEKEQ